MRLECLTPRRSELCFKLYQRHECQDYLRVAIKIKTQLWLETKANSKQILPSFKLMERHECWTICTWRLRQTPSRSKLSRRSWKEARVPRLLESSHKNYNTNVNLKIRTQMRTWRVKQTPGRMNSFKLVRCKSNYGLITAETTCSWEY